ncbi:hypothetical protein HPB50_026977 [Hyalomma asiaticum]|uniref:Uncharacterized protein n=1 Tax=Hyalomma asiaticum TaxID=266040 RepID=A0ACB7T4N2_HYAAI|nr:hypothetical protein HPB50_026977 [Hyalomma asiaticum]
MTSGEPCRLSTSGLTLFAVSEWAFAGVNHSLAGNGGPECALFISMRRRLWETVLAVLWASALALYGWLRLQVPPAPEVVREDRGGKRCLLVLLCLVFGMELGFKFASRTVIYILNPCHIITMLQIVMLAAPPTSRLLTVLFRVHVHWLNGPLLALLFPVLNTRLLPLEQEVYWVQHGLMLAVPCYLMRLGGVFSTEPLADLSWVLLSLALQYLYHFLVLQALALVTEVNLNSMLCPAVSDPFYGPHYRLWALAHQFLLVLVAGKLYTAVGAWLLRVTRLRICCRTDHKHSS